MDHALSAQNGVRIRLQYTLSSESEVLESTEATGPLEFLMGSGRIHPLIEKQLIGKTLADEIDVVIDPSLAFGEVDARLILEVPRHKLPETFKDCDVGMSFEAEDFEGRKRLFRCVKREGAVLTFDGNHEMAGVPLFLQARIEAFL